MRSGVLQLYLVSFSHWATQNPILREIVLPTHTKWSSFTTWKEHLEVILNFLWKKSDVQKLPGGQRVCEELLAKEQRTKQEMLLYCCNTSLSWALGVILISTDKKDIVVWKEITEKSSEDIRGKEGFCYKNKPKPLSVTLRLRKERTFCNRKNYTRNYFSGPLMKKETGKWSDIWLKQKTLLSHLSKTQN